MSRSNPYKHVMTSDCQGFWGVSFSNVSSQKSNVWNVIALTNSSNLLTHQVCEEEEIVKTKNFLFVFFLSLFFGPHLVLFLPEKYSNVVLFVMASKSVLCYLKEI